MNGIYGNSLSLMTKALDGLWKRQEVISNNLANVDTPGYKSQYVTFEMCIRDRFHTTLILREKDFPYIITWRYIYENSTQHRSIKLLQKP